MSLLRLAEAAQDTAGRTIGAPRVPAAPLAWSRVQDRIGRDAADHPAGELGVPDGANIGLIDLVARYALRHGFNVIIEGILRTDHYAPVLTALIADHEGLTCCYYLDVPFGETLRRHAKKPPASKYGAAEMRDWYRELDLLPGGIEQVIPAGTAQGEIVRRIMADSRLAAVRF